MFLTQTSEKTHDPFKILDEILRNQFVVGQTCHPCFWQKKPPKREKTPWCCFSPPPVLQKKSKISSKTASSPGHSAGDLQLLGIFKGHRGDQNHRGWWFFSLSFPHIKSTLLFFRKGLVFFAEKGVSCPRFFATPCWDECPSWTCTMKINQQSPRFINRLGMKSPMPLRWYSTRSFLCQPAITRMCWCHLWQDTTFLLLPEDPQQDSPREILRSVFWWHQAYLPNWRRKSSAANPSVVSLRSHELQI